MTSKGNGEVILINSFTDNGVDIMQKITSNEWRGFRSDTKSQLRTDNSVPVLNIIQGLQKVKPENQDPMDTMKSIQRLSIKTNHPKCIFRQGLSWLLQKIFEVQTEYIGQAAENKSGSPYDKVF